MNIYYLSLKPDTPKNDYWDYGFVNDLLRGNKKEVDKLPKKDRAIVLLPARHHAGLEQEVNKELAKIKHCIFFAMGDEEADFNIDKIKAKHIWVQNPHPDKHSGYNKIGTGYPPQSQELLPKLDFKKTIDVFFSGQITHVRRQEMIKALDIHAEHNPHKLEIIQTKGFTQGLKPAEYLKKMSQAKVVPCPSGAVVPDSFRVFEALESMAVPICDEVSPDGSITNYWDWLLGDNPLIKIKHWQDLTGRIYDIIENYDEVIHRQTAWWLKYKRDFAYKIKEQYEE